MRLRNRADLRNWVIIGSGRSRYDGRDEAASGKPGRRKNKGLSSFLLENTSVWRCASSFFPPAPSPPRTQELVSGVAIIVGIAITAVFVIWLSLLYTLLLLSIVVASPASDDGASGVSERRTRTRRSSRCRHFAMVLGRTFGRAQTSLETCKIQARRLSAGNCSPDARTLFRTRYGLTTVNLRLGLHARPTNSSHYYCDRGNVRAFSCTHACTLYPCASRR